MNGEILILGSDSGVESARFRQIEDRSKQARLTKKEVHPRCGRTSFHFVYPSNAFLDQAAGTSTAASRLSST